MKILIVGAGATGGYFGARLAQAGRDVTFLVRSRRAEQLRANGLQIRSPYGDVKLQPTLALPGDIVTAYDLILLSVKAYSLNDAISDFSPAVGVDTVIVPTLNGIRHIDNLSDRFGAQHVMGGVCVVAATVDEEGRIVQLNEMQSLTYGELDGRSSSRLEAVDQTLKGAGFEARSARNIMHDMWEKWVYIAALGGITCLLRGTIGEIEAVPSGADLASQLLDECSAVAAASGHAPGDEFLSKARATMTAKRSPATSSMSRDVQSGREVEADQILGDMLRRARGFGLDTPLLAAAYVQLSIYAAHLDPVSDR